MKPIKKPKKKPVIETNKGREIATTEPENKEILRTTAPKAHERKAGTVPAEGYATISLSIGGTFNMGDYESARIDVSVTRNVEDSDEKVQEGYRHAGDLLKDELMKQISNMQGEE